MVPIALLAAVIATSLVRGPIRSGYCVAGSSPVVGSNSAHRTVTPAVCAACTQGRTLASWSSRDTTTSSPVRHVFANVPATVYVNPVALGPNTTPAAVPPTRSATASRAAVTISPDRRAASNAVPRFEPPGAACRRWSR